MKLRVIAFVLLLIIVFSSLSVSATGTYETETINVYYDGVKIEQEVLVDGGTILAPISWLTYFGLMKVDEEENEYVVYYPEQKEEKNFARRIFISKDEYPQLKIGYYYSSTSLFDNISKYYSSLFTAFNKLNNLGKVIDEAKTKDELIKSLIKSLGGSASDKTSTIDNYVILYSDEFSKSITHNNELYLPIEELLPLINAKVGVSEDGAICIAPNHYSLFRVLYNNDISVNVFDIDESIIGWQKHTINIVSYSVSTIFSKFQRLDFISKSGEISDYKDIFTDFLTDDEAYLSVVGDADERRAAEYIATTSSTLKTALGTVNSLNIKDKNSRDEEIRIFEMFADTIYTPYDTEYYALKEFDGITQVVGKTAEVMDYLYTYAYQVEDHSKMLDAVYNCNNYSSGKDTARVAAYSVQKSFDESYSTAVVSKIADTVYDDVIEEGIEQIPKAISSSLFSAVRSTGTILRWIPSTKEALDMMDENVRLNYYHDIAKDAYSSYITNIFADDLTREKLEKARLSLLMAMLASKNAYSAEIFGDIHSGKIESITDIIKLLYLAADGTECEGSDYYLINKAALSEEISKVSSVSGGIGGEISNEDELLKYTVTPLVDKTYKVIDENGYSISIKIPYINMESSGADAVNEEIESEYLEEIGFIEDNVLNGYSSHILKINYEYFESNGILGILIETNWIGGKHTYNLYNLDLRSGDQISNDEILNILSLDKSDILILLKSSVENSYLNNYSDSYNSYEECFQASVSDENLETAEYFVKEDKLCALIIVYTIYGQGIAPLIVEIMSVVG